MFVGLLKKVLPPDKLSQVILGGQDGLVNTLGVILGVAAASQDIRVVVAGGLAATFAESISMGAVAYTSKRAEEDHYLSEFKRQKKGIEEQSQEYKKRLEDFYRKKGIANAELTKIVSSIVSNKEAWLSILLSEEGLTPLNRREVLLDALIVFSSALLASFVPLLPFFFLNLKLGIAISLLFSAVTLFVIGFYKGKITVGKPLFNGLELLVIGITAAILGFGIGYVFR